MRSVWILEGGVRTPFVRARGVFKRMTAAALGGRVLKEAVARSTVDPSAIEEVVLGIVSPPVEGSQVAREALFDSGLPPTLPCTTVNRYCASSAEAISGVAAHIEAGRMDLGLAGGVESISTLRAFFSQEATDFFQDIMKKKTWGERLRFLRQVRLSYWMPEAPGIREPTTGLTMGQSADLMAREFQVLRAEQDAYALQSHLKAAAAWDQGFYQTHVVSVGTPEGQVVDRDTDIRADANLEKLASLSPVFYRDGTLTAGNSSPLTDGASALLLASEERAKAEKWKPLGRIRAVVASAVNLQTDPLLIGPAYAIPKALKKAGIQWKDLDLIEIHEAFAAQVLATFRALESKKWALEKLGLSDQIAEIDPTRVNVNGGSIALGHPFGATGGRMVLQALYELRRRKKNLALLSICAAGGLGMVLVLEALD